MHELWPALGFMKWTDMGNLWMDMTDAVSFVYLYVKRANEVAPPTTLGTEEWTARTSVGGCG
jgi:hypothetical protein